MWNRVLITLSKMIQWKNQKLFPGRPQKNILPIGHLETNSAHLITVRQIFRRKSEMFAPQVEIYFKKPTIFSSKCSSGDVNCTCDDSVEKFRQISNNFASKSKLNWKTNTFLKKNPQKVLGTLRRHFQQKWNFWFKTNTYFAWIRS